MTIDPEIREAAAEKERESVEPLAFSEATTLLRDSAADRRERIATAAMQGLIAAGDERLILFTAEEAVHYADALIAALEGE